MNDSYFRRIPGMITTTSKNVSPSRMSDNSIGKIVKNSKRVKTESTVGYSSHSFSSNVFNNSLKVNGDYSAKNQKPISTSISTLFSQNQGFKERNKKDKENAYQKKLASYESSKSKIFKELKAISQEKKIKMRTQFEEEKRQHFLITLLKGNMGHACAEENNRNIKNVRTATEGRGDSEQNSKLFKKTMKLNERNKLSKKRVSFNLEQSACSTKQSQKFIHLLNNQIFLETQLRDLKKMITLLNKQKIKEYIISNYPETNSMKISKIMNIQFEEFEPLFKIDINDSNSNFMKETISAETIADKLIELYELCEQHWHRNIYKKFDYQFVKELFDKLNLEKQCSEIGLKDFTRELNIVYKSKYESKDIFRIHERFEGGCRKGNFIYMLSKD